MGLRHHCPKNISTAPKITAHITGPKNMLSTNWNREHSKLLWSTHRSQ